MPLILLWLAWWYCPQPPKERQPGSVRLGRRLDTGRRRWAWSQAKNMPAWLRTV